jgi:dolichyl-diphosphooligosaccharide--protein glycosyltransferase
LTISSQLRALAGRPTITRRNMIVALTLVSVFVIALFMRAFPAKYGFFLNEFDPYYDYKAASFIVASFDASWHAGQGGFPGLLKYFNWTDYTTWFPEGRAVAPTSQDGLQFAGALSYLFFRNVFGLQMSLYNYLVLFPVFVGSLTAVVFYFLVKRIAGEAGGLFAALMIAVSPPLIERGNLGWFKSEPLGIFLFALSSYIFLTLLDSDMSKRQRVFRGIIAGFLLGYANTAWGGAEYFTAAFGLFFIILPFLDLDLSKLAITGLFFTAGDIFGSAIFPRPGVEVVTSAEGLAIIGGTLFIIVANWLKTWVKPDDFKKTLLKVMFGAALAGLALISFGSVSTLSARYLSVIFPWVRSGNPLVESVAEQALPTGSDYFSSYLLLLLLGIFGAIVAFRRRNPATIFALVIGITMIYASAAFSRLLVYSSIAFVLLAGIGFAELAFSLMKPNVSSLVKRKPSYATGSEMRTVYSVAFIVLLAFPAAIFWIPNPVPCTTNSLVCDQSPADYGTSIANGGTIFAHSELTDWTQALTWISQNTPQNAVIIAWWDYGYWINVMGNRTTVADNATLNDTRIAEIGQMFMSNITQAATLAKDMGDGRPVYVLSFLTGSLIQFGTSSSSSSSQDYYALQIPAGNGFTAGGGDESKKQWFIRIAGLNESQYLECPTVQGTICTGVDDFNLTPYTIQNTLFGQMLPFTFAGYYDLASGGTSTTYAFDSNGNPPLELFSYPPSYQLSGNSSPFQIAFTSSSLTSPIECGGSSSQPIYCFTTVLVYKVN